MTDKPIAPMELRARIASEQCATIIINSTWSPSLDSLLNIGFEIADKILERCGYALPEDGEE